MQKQFLSHSTFVTLRRLAILLVCGVACSTLTGTLLGFLSAESPSKSSGRTLTFAERVEYQRAIEDVYWRHRIWPKENPDPKPPLNAVMSQTQLEKKAEDYLRDSQVLEDYWQRPLTAGQLQAEMDRMAQHTRQPEVLNELFARLLSPSVWQGPCSRSERWRQLNRLSSRWSSNPAKPKSEWR